MDPPFLGSAVLLWQKPGISKVGVYLQVRKCESGEGPQTSKAEARATLAPILIVRIVPYRGVGCRAQAQIHDMVAVPSPRGQEASQGYGELVIDEESHEA